MDSHFTDLEHGTDVEHALTVLPASGSLEALGAMQETQLYRLYMCRTCDICVASYIMMIML